MLATSLIPLSFSQGTAAQQLLTRSPLLTSRQTPWRDIYLEYHQQPSHETPEHCLSEHTISISLGAFQTERWLDGKFRRETNFPGSVSIIPAYATHLCAWDRVGDALILTIEPLFLASLAQEWEKADGIELLPTFARQSDLLLLQLGLALKAELESGCLGGDLYSDAIAHLIATHLLRNYSSVTPPPVAPSGGLSQRNLRQISGYIEAHLAETLTIAELAAIADLSPFHFCRMFKRSLLLTPHQYVMQQRVERAKRLLQQSEVSISAITQQCGFANPSHLSKWFRQLTGITPTAYRGE
jgi:AraC family transcriptional regulator